MSLKANNTLRHFTSVDDLFDTVENETILEWVNELFATKAKVRTWGQRHRLKRKLFEQTLKEMLQPDEMERLMGEVEEKMEERG